MTTDEKVKLFARYYGCKCRYRNPYDVGVWRYDVVSWEALNYIENTDVLEIQLIARHLSSITDAEAIQVAEAATERKGWVREEMRDEYISLRLPFYLGSTNLIIYSDWSIEQGTTINNQIEPEFSESVPINMSVLDTLRSLGFAEDWMFEAGLCIEEE